MKILLIDNNCGRINTLINIIYKYSINVDVISPTQYANPNDYDWVILTGTDIAPHLNLDYYSKEIELVKNCKVPLLAICGGHHLLNLAFNGTIKSLDQAIYGKIEFNKGSDIFCDYKQEKYFTKNRYVIDKLSTEFISIAEYKENIYAIKHKEKPLYGCQIHPERGKNKHYFFENFFNKVVQYNKYASERITRLSVNNFKGKILNKKTDNVFSKIDMGEGNPDIQPNERIIKQLHNFCLEKDIINTYPSRRGSRILQNALKNYYTKNKGYVLDDNTVFMPTLGSKEVMAHTTLAFLNRGDTILIPQIAYPFYRRAAEYAGAAIFDVPVDRRYIPLIDRVSEDVLKKAKMMWINYPNNPTGAMIEQSDLIHLYNKCLEYDIILCNDMAYESIVNIDNKNSSSLFMTNENTKNYIELHSFSKSYSIPGWRTGFILGQNYLIDLIESSKSVFDTGLFIGFQKMIVYLLKNEDVFKEEIRIAYKERAEYFTNEMKKLGFDVNKSEGTPYSWVKTPANYTSSEFVDLLYEKCNIIILSGEVFGTAGTGYIRFSLTQPMHILEEAISRIRCLLVEMSDR
ncbi:MAG: aminotransferase class I/II-fold pyridoxal phosphate-dependent enzyme [Alphaproteobacteria bacterium]|nr:aminotransferase class I/II-fold pyridoxal phosphate-dependent enzyme [Alphaproteobacteria bacterium]